jgi:2-iminobutanoate/2-iminopropanoate deaminase
MKKRILKHPDKTANTGAYSAGVESDGWVYISGHASTDMATGKVIPGSVREQTERTLTHIGKILAEAGCTFADVVKCTCHLANIADFDEFNRVYAEFFPENPPARTTVQSVLWNNLKVEIDAIARASRSKSCRTKARQ